MGPRQIQLRSQSPQLSTRKDLAGGARVFNTQRERDLDGSSLGARVCNSQQEWGLDGGARVRNTQWERDREGEARICNTQWERDLDRGARVRNTGMGTRRAQLGSQSPQHSTGVGRRQVQVRS